MQFLQENIPKQPENVGNLEKEIKRSCASYIYFLNPLVCNSGKKWKTAGQAPTSSIEMLSQFNKLEKGCAMIC